MVPLGLFVDLAGLESLLEMAGSGRSIDLARHMAAGEHSCFVKVYSSSFEGRQSDHLTSWHCMVMAGP